MLLNVFFILYSLTFVIGVQANCDKIEFYWKWTTRKLAFYLALTNFIMLGIRINWYFGKETEHTVYTYLKPPISNWTLRPCPNVLMKQWKLPPLPPSPLSEIEHWKQSYLIGNQNKDIIRRRQLKSGPRRF